MRDYFILFGLIFLLGFALKKPQVGLLSWIWMSVMNPHRLTYGELYDFPLLDMVATITIISCIVHWKERQSTRLIPLASMFFIFYAWTTLVTLFSVDYALSIPQWIEFSKTVLIIALMLLFMNKKHWIIAAVAVLVLSIGFFGVKGGGFTILTGGAYRVWGPPTSQWGDNNAVSIAVLIAMPLCLSLRNLFVKRSIRLVLIFASVCMFFAILGTQSRGALVGLVGMGLVMVIRSRQRAKIFMLVALMTPVGYMAMPDSWKDRMYTIQSYEEDASAMTRIIQWGYAIDIANERPLFGNGFDAFYHQPYYYRYIADKDANRSVHSNYFQVLGEQGYIGLIIYLVIMIMAVISCRRWSIVFAKNEETKWSASILEALQFSIAGYAFNGLTINMAYIDLYYYLIAFVVLLIANNCERLPRSHINGAECLPNNGRKSSILKL